MYGKNKNSRTANDACSINCPAVLNSCKGHTTTLLQQCHLLVCFCQWSTYKTQQRYVNIYMWHPSVVTTEAKVCNTYYFTGKKKLSVFTAIRLHVLPFLSHHQVTTMSIKEIMRTHFLLFSLVFMRSYTSH